MFGPKMGDWAFRSGLRHQPARFEWDDGERPHDDGKSGDVSTIDFRIHWVADGTNPQDTGAEDVSLRAFARGFPVDLTPIGNMTIITPAEQGYGSCRYIEWSAFGINSSAPENATRTEGVPEIDHLVPANYRLSNNFTRADGKDVTWIDLWEEGGGIGFGDGSLNLFGDELFVAAYPDCFTQPSTAGWYRWYGYLNGSNDGKPSERGADDDDALDDHTDDWRTDDWWGNDPSDAAAAYSHWYYVCNCTDRQDAEQTLGLPPDYHPYRNASMRAPNHEHGVNLTLHAPGSKDRLPGPDPPSTPTPTPSPTPTPTETPTPTPTPPPISGNSPGFGPVVAVVGVVVMALLGRYRSKS